MYGVCQARGGSDRMLLMTAQRELKEKDESYAGCFAGQAEWAKQNDERRTRFRGVLTSTTRDRSSGPSGHDLSLLRGGLA